MIELKNVCFCYGKSKCLNNVSLELPKGKLVCVVGPNGSGKSTLLKTTVGILPLLSGQILVDNTDISTLSRKDYAKRISYLAQGNGVPDMTVMQLVLHGRFPHLSYPRKYGNKDKAIAKNALEQMGISELCDRPLTSLSGGMRQKTYIAMALTQDTDYVLLDEPTTYLDISGQLELMKTLRSLADNGKGVVTVMHDLPLAFGCSDIIAVLKDGEIFDFDRPKNVCEKGVIKEVFGVELKYCKSGNYYYFDRIFD